MLGEFPSPSFLEYFMQKHIFITMGIVSMIIIGSCSLSSYTTTKESNTHTGVTLASDHSGVETDTAKRLETMAHSGTHWGMSPFGSGKPLEVAQQVFTTPNTEWKTRTITLKDGRVVTYRFGDGDPEGSDPLI